ncbi:MAG: VanZ family protein [Deltaproteobacteria bacterium]|nr:VanZ family protein [Deltaproteobacteria bacterium]
MPLKTATRIIIRFAFFVAYAGIITWLSLTSHPPRIGIKWLSWDKVQHALAYFLLTFFAGRAFIALVLSRKKAWFLAFVFSIIFGSLMEVAQGTFSRVRGADAYDILANACGALAIYLLACLIPQISGKPVHAARPSPDPGNTTNS